MTTLPSPTSPIHLNHQHQPHQSQSQQHQQQQQQHAGAYYHHPQRPLSYAAPTDSWDHPFFRPAVLHIDRPPRGAHHHNQQPPTSTSPTSPTSPPPTNSASAQAQDQPAPPHPPTRPTVRIDQYTLGRTLGQGSMGKVKLATDPDGTRYAIKIIPRSGHLTNEDDAAAETRVVREASVLFLLNHPNIVKLVDALVTPQHFYLVMEFVDGPQLLDHVVARGRLSEEEARRVAVGLISAMAYCHHHHIVHRDLKIENILLTKTNQIKLLDFGLANFYDPHAHLHTFCGSLYFASPELISAQPYTGPEVDAWSLGVVLYVLVTARVPFDAPTLPELHAKIKRGNPQFPPHCSPALVDLLRKLLTVDPRTRATVHEAAQHPWL
ncbi:kinase-like domain-containing protein, partial [Catenaria anguillulae PL171]